MKLKNFDRGQSDFSKLTKNHPFALEEQQRNAWLKYGMNTKEESFPEWVSNLKSSNTLKLEAKLTKLKSTKFCYKYSDCRYSERNKTF